MGDKGTRIVGMHHAQFAIPPGEQDVAAHFSGSVIGLTRVAKPPELARRGGAWFGDAGSEVHLGVEEPFSPARKAQPAFLVRDLATMGQKIGLIEPVRS